ncbi:hypothetical protein SNEBB_004443 [Seison nebaliae]|nr:hypothetical protein SNEBB_004443 [Seison nebaliae]
MWHYLLELLNIRSTKLSIAEQVFQAAQESLETMKLMEELTEKSSETSYPHPIENRERSRELCESDIIFYEGLVKQHSEALFSFINGRTIVDSEATAEDCDISSVIEVSGWRPISQTQLENIVKRLQLSLTCLKNQMKLKMTYENETFHVMKRVPLKLTEQSEKQFISKSIGNKFRKHVDRLRNCFIKSPSSDICKKVEIVEYEKISSIHNFSNKPTNGPETGNVLNNFRRRAMKKLGLKRNSIKKPSFPKQNKNERAELK